MFVLDQRAFIPNISSLALRRSSNIRDDKIKINKLDVYHKDRIDLKN